MDSCCINIYLPQNICPARSPQHRHSLRLPSSRLGNHPSRTSRAASKGAVSGEWICLCLLHFGFLQWKARKIPCWLLPSVPFPPDSVHRAPSRGHISRGRLSKAALWVPSWHKLLLKHPDSEIRFEWGNKLQGPTLASSNGASSQATVSPRGGLWTQDEHRVRGQDLGSSLLCSTPALLLAVSLTQFPLTFTLTQ